MAKLFRVVDFEITAITHYNSLNLRKYCKKIFVVKDYSLKTLEKIFLETDPYQKKSFLLGSGFAENHKRSKIFNNRKNYGNDFKVNCFVKNSEFFKKLKKNKILFPKLIKKNALKQTLIKNFKSFGSQNVKKLENINYNLKKNEYFQEIIDGKRISVQFISKINKLRIISVCDQVLKKKTFFIDYLITKRLSKKKRNQIFTLVKKIVKLFNLKGINNIDIIDKKNKLYLIEINSRPVLSSNIIYKINKSPFIQNKNNLQNNLLATKIIYSSKQITINKKIIKFFKEYCNPNNFSELPNERDIIKVNEPICLLHLMAKTKKLLEKKLNIETDNFLTKIEKNL